MVDGKKFADRLISFMENITVYGVSFYNIEDPPEGIYCVFDNEMILSDWERGFESPIDCGLSSPMHVRKVAELMKNPPSILMIEEAEKKVYQLVYDCLNRAGFSVEWSGTIDEPVYIRLDEDLKLGEKDPE